MAPVISRTDPIDNAGLFVGRRSRTVPAAALSGPGAQTRFLTRCMDECLSLAILGVEVALVLSVWTAQPLGWLWVASQVSYLTGSVPLGLLAALAGLIAGLVVTLAVLLRLDHGWKLVRRATGRKQPHGALEGLFVAATVLFVPAFVIWLLAVGGVGSMIFPARPS